MSERAENGREWAEKRFATARALDESAERPDEVEASYRAAVAAAPTSARYHGALVSFLVCRGRITAARQAWADAVQAVTADVGAIEQLHLEVARTLVAHGEDAFARSVLAAVPATLRGDSCNLVERWVAAFEEVRSGGAFVPAGRLREGWWREPPQELPATHDGTPLESWLAGRIESIEGGRVDIVAAVIDDFDAPTRPQTASLSLPVEDLAADQLARAEESGGGFVEIGLYADGSTERRIVEGGALPPLEHTLDPARWLPLGAPISKRERSDRN